MPISILNNIPSLAAQNQLALTGASLQKTLFRLSSGSRINTGADDAAGLAIADGLRANISALPQSARNATDGIGKLQVADGALAQVTNLLNRAVTLATESANGTVSADQRTALDAEFAQIKAEIDRIGLKTTFNGQTIFTGVDTVNDTNKYLSTNVGNVTTATTFTTGTQTLVITDTKTGSQKTYTASDYADLGAMITAIEGDEGTGVGQLDISVAIVSGKLEIKDSSGDHSLYITSDITELGGAMAASTQSVGTSDVFISDGGDGISDTITTTIDALSTVSLSLTHDLSNEDNAELALTEITDAIASIAAQRGTMGADINRLQSATNVINSQVQNLSAAEDGIRAADIAQEVASMTKFNILNQTGISALAQANQMQQVVLGLLR